MLKNNENCKEKLPLFAATVRYAEPSIYFQNKIKNALISILILSTMKEFIR